MKLFNYLLAGILCASAIAVSAQHRADPQKLVDPESFSMICLVIHRGIPSMILTSRFLIFALHGLRTT